MNHYKNTFHTWNKLATMYQDQFMDLNLYNDTYDSFCKRLGKANPKILEIGCGPGNITKYMLSRRPDFSVLGIDIAPDMIKLAQRNNPAAQFKIMDCREIESLTSKFDAILCGFCMPYLAKDDCAKLIKDCSGLLNPGGVFYFSAIEDDYQKSGYETSSDGQFKMFVYYYEEGYFNDMLSENNFEVVDLKRKNYSKSNGADSTHIIIIAKRFNTG